MGSKNTMSIKTVVMLSIMSFLGAQVEGQGYTPAVSTSEQTNSLEGCNPKAAKCLARPDFNTKVEEAQAKPKAKPTHDQRKQKAGAVGAKNKLTFGEWDPTFYHRYDAQTMPPSRYGSNSHEGMLRGGGGDPSYPGMAGGNPSSVGTVDSYRR
jgi:hypothetical protein